MGRFAVLGLLAAWGGSGCAVDTVIWPKPVSGQKGDQRGGETNEVAAAVVVVESGETPEARDWVARLQHQGVTAVTVECPDPDSSSCLNDVEAAVLLLREAGAEQVILVDGPPMGGVISARLDSLDELLRSA